MVLVTTYAKLSLQPGNAQSAPYAPQYASLGGVPAVLPDIPVTSVFLFLFSIGAAAHMTIFQLNKKISHKFLFSIILFGECRSMLIKTSHYG